MVTKLDDGAQNPPLGFQSVGNGGGSVSYVTRANLDRSDKIASDANPKSRAVSCVFPTSTMAPLTALIATRRPFGAMSAKSCLLLISCKG